MFGVLHNGYYVKSLGVCYHRFTLGGGILYGRAI